MIEDQGDIDALMDGSTSEVTLLFDTGHLHVGGADVLESLCKWGDCVHHAHYKDVRQDVVTKVRHEYEGFLDGVIEGAFTVPGDPEGCIDFPEVTKALAGSCQRKLT